MKLKTLKIISFFLIISLWGCNEKVNETSSFENKEINDERIILTQAQYDQSKMTIGSMENKSFPKVINVNGMIDIPPENRAVVHAKMGGYIKTIPFLNGDKVQKGQELLKLENPDFIAIQQQYLEVFEELSYLKAEFDRQTSMKAENITSQKSFLKAESNYNTAIASYEGLKKQLVLLNISPSNVEQGNITSVVTIYAPISGSVTKISATKGSYVSPATEIMVVIDNSHVHLELSVFEKDIMNVKNNQEIDFKIPEASSKIFKANVYLIGAEIEKDRTIKVHAHLQNEEENNFLVGMYVNANIITNAVSGKALPSEAMVEVDDKFYVLELDAKEGNTYYFNQRKVNELISYDGYSLIENPDSFKENSKFLTKGAYNLIGE